MKKIEQAWKEISIEMVNKTISKMQDYAKRCLDANGGYF